VFFIYCAKHSQCLLGDELAANVIIEQIFFSAF